VGDPPPHRARPAAEKLAIGPGYQRYDLVFAQPDGGLLNPKRITEWFDRRAAAAGLPAIRLHDLRHSHATHLLARGVPTKVVSERLGHAQESFTMSRYQHVLPGCKPTPPRTSPTSSTAEREPHNHVHARGDERLWYCNIAPRLLAYRSTPRQRDRQSRQLDSCERANQGRARINGHANQCRTGGPTVGHR